MTLCQYSNGTLLYTLSNHISNAISNHNIAFLTELGSCHAIVTLLNRCPVYWQCTCTVHNKFRIMATRQPLPRPWHAAVGIGSKLYVWGGCSSSSTISTRTLSLETFDVPSVTWEEPQVLHGSDMPEGLRGMAVTSDGQTSYSFGGRAGSHPYTYYNTLFQVIPSQHLCQELQPTSSSNTAPDKTSASCILQFQDKLVLQGGYTGQSRTNELYVFDLKESECELWYCMVDTWSESTYVYVQLLLGFT